MGQNPPDGGTIGAKRHDGTRGRETLESMPVKRPAPPPVMPQGRCLAQGDDDAAGRDVLAEFGFTAHIRARGEEATALTQDAGFRARRWVVERMQRGMKRFRRGLIRSDQHVRNSRGCLQVAWASITYRPSGLLG